MPAARAALASLCIVAAANAFPLQSWLLSNPVPPDAAAPAATAVETPSEGETPSPGVPCRSHRPLPPVDAVEGLGWLDHIVDSASSSPCFKDVNLGWEGIRDSDVDKVVRVIEAGVEVLSVFQNQLTDESASQLADAMKGSRLRELDLAHNLFGDAGAEAFAAALFDAPLLRILRLNANDRIGDRGARAFTTAIKTAVLMLDELWLSSPHIGKEAKEELRLAWVGSGRPEDTLHF